MRLTQVLKGQGRDGSMGESSFGLVRAVEETGNSLTNVIKKMIL